jgi:hypothetical protein
MVREVEVIMAQLPIGANGHISNHSRERIWNTTVPFKRIVPGPEDLPKSPLLKSLQHLPIAPWEPSI